MSQGNRLSTGLLCHILRHTTAVMDVSDKNLVFDERGVCNRCNEYEQRIATWWNHGKGHEGELQQLLAEIKRSGEGKPYDCILGLSGGLDSSYMLPLLSGGCDLSYFMWMQGGICQ